MLCAGWLVLNPGSNKRPLGDATWSVSGRSQETRREAGPDTWGGKREAVGHLCSLSLAACQVPFLHKARQAWLLGLWNLTDVSLSASSLNS